MRGHEPLVENANKSPYMNILSSNSTAEQALSSFDACARHQALAQLAAQAAPPPVRPQVNMHIHSFFSFNARGYSPSQIAWEARQAGLYAAGLCDFDVLDGLEEFLQAGFTLGLRVAVSLETRAFLSEYAQMDINSPGEPGVAYIMGAGFSRLPLSQTTAARTLAELRHQAGERNFRLAQRINASLPEIAVDYASEVVGLSPGGCPTERHLVRAYRLKAETAFPVRQRLYEFWARLMNKAPAALERIAAVEPDLEDAIRAILVKRGGLGYEPPTPKSFPSVDEFIAWVINCGAIPMIAWLDGTSAGEQDAQAMLACLQAKGAAALNIIPDRNHNIADPEERAIKLQKLSEVIAAATALAMPISIGTEMNKQGQPFVDNTSAAALRSYHEIFMRGARILVGQSLLARYASFAYSSSAAQAEFGSDLHGKNKFFEEVGALAPLTEARASKLEDLGSAKALACLWDSAVQKQWRI